jgi:hypothetical protein
MQFLFLFKHKKEEKVVLFLLFRFCSYGGYLFLLVHSIALHIHSITLEARSTEVRSSAHNISSITLMD